MENTSHTTHTIPDCLNGTQVTDSERSGFWQAMTKGATSADMALDNGFMKGMMLETDIMLTARSQATNHGAGKWQYVILDEEKQLFFMYPDANHLYVPANNLRLATYDYHIEAFDPKSYGFYVTLLAMQKHAASTNDEHWKNISEQMRKFVDDALSVEIAAKWSDARVEDDECPRGAVLCFEAYGLVQQLLDN